MNGVSQLVTEVRARADEIDDQASIPVDLAARLKSAELFTLLLPASVGGPDMPYPDYVRLVEQFAHADASRTCTSSASIYKGGRKFMRWPGPT